MEKNRLDEIRSEIDKVDQELSMLLQKRMDLVCQVAEFKRQTKTEILDASREQKVLDNALSAVTNLEYKGSIRSIFEFIMANSKAFQKSRLSTKKDSLKKYALIGEHLSHSLSPEIHKRLFTKANINATYELMEIPPNQLPELLMKLCSEGFSGINVTIPYKTEIMRSLGKLDEQVLNIGAVNTIKIGEICIGYNTDYFGFGASLEYHGFDAKNKACAVLGSGGASRAVVSYLEDHGASRIAIVTRDTDATSFKYPGLQSIGINEFSAQGFDLVVNTTPVGMSPKPGFSPITKEQLEGAGFVVDLIFNPKETQLLAFARESGIPYANGLYMLVAQAVRAEELWQEVSFGQTVINSIYEEINKL